MLELEEALAQILARTPRPVNETIPLIDAYCRVLAQSAISTIDVPCFDNSAMDGYAVRAEDVLGAKAERPALLRLGGRVAAGESFIGKVAPTVCIRVFTGSPLPDGADAVVMQEDTLPGEPGQILITDQVKPWENVRFRGEDVKRGAVLAKQGEILSAGRLSLLAAAGVAQVEVGRQPLVGLLATGSELREPGSKLAPGQIYESNRFGLSALLRAAGGRPRTYPPVADTPEKVRGALEAAFSESDAVITSGGVSVGEMDLIKSALEDAGGTVQFWRVAVKPGRPFVFGEYRGKLLFGLPGNPASALLTFVLLVRPALLRWQGATDVSPLMHPGVLGESLANAGPRRHFIRVKVDPGGNVFSSGLQASHALSSLGEANGLVDVPPATTLEAGTKVQVIRWDV